MTKNPYTNALLALAYITLVATLIWFVGQHAPKEDTILAPIAGISLFTLSAAIMAYIFMFQPLELFLGGNKKEAVKLFLKTVVSFALLTIAVFVAATIGFLQ